MSFEEVETHRHDVKPGKQTPPSTCAPSWTVESVTCETASPVCWSGGLKDSSLICRSETSDTVLVPTRIVQTFR